MSAGFSNVAGSLSPALLQGKETHWVERVFSSAANQSSLANSSFTSILPQFHQSYQIQTTHIENNSLWMFEHPRTILFSRTNKKCKLFFWNMESSVFGTFSNHLKLESWELADSEHSWEKYCQRSILQWLCLSSILSSKSASWRK